MSRETWPAALDQACFDTWLGEVNVPGREEEVDAFAQHWGGFEPDALKRMIQQGNSTERLFALFALGYSTRTEEELFTSFLSSLERKERWASAIGLGRLQKRRVFPVLQALLLEEIEYRPLYDKEIRDRVEEAVDEAIEHAGADWERCADPVVGEMWQRERASQEDYRWYTHHRLTITDLFDAWGDPRALPPLHHALATCEALEQRSDFEELPQDALEGWSTFLHRLRITIEHLES